MTCDAAINIGAYHSSGVDFVAADNPHANKLGKTVSGTDFGDRMGVVADSSRNPSWHSACLFGKTVSGTDFADRMGA